MLRARQLVEDGAWMADVIRKISQGGQLTAQEVWRVEKLVEAGRGKTEEVRKLLEGMRPLFTPTELYLKSLTTEFGYFCEVDVEEALNFAARGVAEDDPSGLCHAQAGCLHETRDEFDEAHELYEESANRECAVGLRRLADLHEDHLLDDEAAFALMEQSAELGDPGSIDALGALIEESDAPDALTRALMLYSEAASQGEEDAMQHLGVMFSEGRGVRRDVRRAARYFRLASFEGNREAEEALVALQQEDSSNTVPWGEWQPDWFYHRWCTPEIHNEMLTVLKMNRRPECKFSLLPKALIITILFWLCCEPRVTEAMLVRATSKKVDLLVSEVSSIKKEVSSIKSQLATVIDLLQRT